MGAKASAPPPPDYTPLIAAQKEQSASSDKAAQLSFDLGREQLGLQRQAFDKASAQGDEYFQTYKDSLTKNQALFDQVWPGIQTEMDLQNRTSQKAQDYLDTQISAADQARTHSDYLWDRYTNQLVPVQNQLIDIAKGYNSPERAAAEAARAKGDVATAMDAARTNAEMALHSYGITPDQGRSQAFDRAQDVAKAAAMASAGTQSRIGTEQRGLALMGAVNDMATGAPGQVAQSLALTSGIGTAGFGAANQSGVAGVNAGLSGVGTSNTINPSATYGSLALNPYVNALGPFGSSGTGIYGSGSNLMGTAAQALSGAAQTQNMGFSNALQSYQANQQADQGFFGGIGKLVGGIGSAATLFSDRRLKTDIERVGALDIGLPVYRYRYKGDPTVQIGLMADEVEQVRPEAVVTTPSGYKAVDYRAATALAHA